MTAEVICGLACSGAQQNYDLAGHEELAKRDTDDTVSLQTYDKAVADHAAVFATNFADKYALSI